MGHHCRKTLGRGQQSQRLHIQEQARDQGEAQQAQVLGQLGSHYEGHDDAEDEDAEDIAESEQAVYDGSDHGEPFHKLATAQAHLIYYN